MSQRASMFASLALSALTAGALAQAPAPKAPRPTATRVSGVVSSVNAAAGTLTLQSRKAGSKEFSIPSAATITKGGKKVPLSALAPGDHVTVALKGLPPDQTVVSVAARTPRTEKPASK